MSGSREKDSSDFDLEQFVDLFDTAMSSDNPAVKRALKNLLMIATLVDSDLSPEQRVKGPLRRLVDDLQNINRRMSQLESNNTAQQSRSYPNVMNPHWVTTQPNTVPVFPGTSVTPGTGTGKTPWPPGTIIGSGTGSYTLTSTTAVDDQYLPDQQHLHDLLDKKYQTILNRLEDK